MLEFSPLLPYKTGIIFQIRDSMFKDEKLWLKFIKSSPKQKKEHLNIEKHSKPYVKYTNAFLTGENLLFKNSVSSLLIITA
jgi:hypothetical protein